MGSCDTSFEIDGDETDEIDGDETENPGRLLGIWLELQCACCCHVLTWG